MFKVSELSIGDLVADFHGTVVRINGGIGGRSLGAPVFVTVSDWTNGRESTLMLDSDQTVLVWE